MTSPCFLIITPTQFLFIFLFYRATFLTLYGHPRMTSPGEAIVKDDVLKLLKAFKADPSKLGMGFDKLLLISVLFN